MDEMRGQQIDGASDRDLARVVLHHGDERAFREIYRRHTPCLLGFVSRLLGGREAEAEDVVQETWIRACDGLERFRWESAFSTWLLGIGLNVALQQMRRDARSGSVRMEEALDPPAPASTHEDRIDLERAVESLPGGYRTVLLLHDVEGMSHSEIAERLGISVGTSKSQLSNARRLLRTVLSASMEIGHV